MKVNVQIKIALSLWFLVIHANFFPVEEMKADIKAVIHTLTMPDYHIVGTTHISTAMMEQSSKPCIMPFFLLFIPNSFHFI